MQEIRSLSHFLKKKEIEKKTCLKTNNLIVGVLISIGGVKQTIDRKLLKISELIKECVIIKLSESFLVRGNA